MLAKASARLDSNLYCKTDLKTPSSSLFILDTLKDVRIPVPHNNSDTLLGNVTLRPFYLWWPEAPGQAPVLYYALTGLSDAFHFFSSQYITRPSRYDWTAKLITA